MALYRWVIPDLSVRSIYDIDFSLLKRLGIRGLMMDLDNTLVGATTAYATPALHQWISHARNENFALVILSNNGVVRVRQFADPLHLPYVYAARKPFPIAFWRALRMMALPPQHVAIIGDQMMTDVLGGKRMGLYTIKVEPIALGEEKWFTRRINRTIESWIVARLRKKGMYT